MWRPGGGSFGPTWVEQLFQLVTASVPYFRSCIRLFACKHDQNALFDLNETCGMLHTVQCMIMCGFVSMVLSHYVFYFSFVFLSRISTMTREQFCPSVCLSVRPLRSAILWKRFNILSQFLHRTVAQSFQFYEYQTSSQNSDWVTPCGALNTA